MGRLTALVTYIFLFPRIFGRGLVLGDAWILGIFVFVPLGLYAFAGLFKRYFAGIHGLSLLLFIWIAPLFAIALLYARSPIEAVAGAFSISTSSPSLLNSSRILALLATYLFMLAPGTTWTRAALCFLPEDTVSCETAESVNPGLGHAGRIIGHLERLMILTLTLVGQFSAIGFILTAKSIARFEFIRRGQAEYYLLGTLASSFLAVMSGILLLKLWPYLN